jgi:hypothetical protein
MSQANYNLGPQAAWTWLPAFLGPLALVASVGLAVLAARGLDEAPLLVSVPGRCSFGAVSTDSVRGVFVLTNRSSHPIDIDRIVTSCGCTAYDVSSRHIEPHRSSEAACVVDLRGRRGHVEQKVRVIYHSEADPSDQQVLSCLLDADVVSLVDASPDALTFVIGHSAVQRVRVASMAGHTFLPTGAQCNHPALRGELAADGRSVNIIFDAFRWRDGEGSATATISTNCKSEPRIDIPVRVLQMPPGP